MVTIIHLVSCCFSDIILKIQRPSFPLFSCDSTMYLTFCSGLSSISYMLYLSSVSLGLTRLRETDLSLASSHELADSEQALFLLGPNLLKDSEQLLLDVYRLPQSVSMLSCTGSGLETSASVVLGLLFLTIYLAVFDTLFRPLASVGLPSKIGFVDLWTSLFLVVS